MQFSCGHSKPCLPSAILLGMTDPTSTRRRFCLTPAWLICGLLVVEGLLWLSERYRWFWFNEKKGWTVLIVVAVVGVAMILMLLWFVVALLFRWRFQFTIRSMLVLTVAVAIPCSWMTLEMQQAKRQREAVEAITSVRVMVFDASGEINYAEPKGPAWLQNLLGVGFFDQVEMVIFVPSNQRVTDEDLEHFKELNQLEALLILVESSVTDAGLEHLKGLTRLKVLDIRGSKVTDAGLEHLKGLTQLQDLHIENTPVTDERVKKLQQALPHCKIHH